MFEKLGGRKFVLSLLVIAVGTAVQILSPNGVTSEFVALLVGVAGVFGAANAVVTNKAISEGPTSTDLTSDLNNRVAGLEQAAATTTQVLEATAKRVAALSQFAKPS